MRLSYAPAIAAGVLSAALFLLVAALGLGFFFMFLPTLPFFYLGLSGKISESFTAVIVATAITAFAAGPEVGCIMLLFLGLPSWYIVRYSLLSRTTEEGAREWFPIGITLLHLTLYGCFVIAMMTLYYTGTEGGIMQVVSDHVSKEFTELEAEYAGMLDVVAKRWAYLIFAMTLWLWVLALFAHTWIANRLLTNNGRALRARVGMQVFSMPGWVLSLIAICALASLIGSPSMQFLAKSTLISLMLPYFLLGCALMHETSKSWPSRGFFLFFVYFMIFAQLWPAILIALIGFTHHIKRLSGAATSSKS